MSSIISPFHRKSRQYTMIVEAHTPFTQVAFLICTFEYIYLCSACQFKVVYCGFIRLISTLFISDHPLLQILIILRSLCLRRNGFLSAKYAVPSFFLWLWSFLHVILMFGFAEGVCQCVIL